MKQSTQIIKARPEHLNEIVEIVNAGATTVRKDREFVSWEDYQPAFEALCAAPEVDIYVALNSHDEVIGTYQIHYLRGLTFKGRPRVELESVHVRSDQRGKGIGRLLMDHAEGLARKADACMIQLTSNREREGSHHFYKRLGFDQSHFGYKKMLT